MVTRVLVDAIGAQFTFWVHMLGNPSMYQKPLHLDHEDEYPWERVHAQLEARISSALRFRS